MMLDIQEYESDALLGVLGRQLSGVIYIGSGGFGNCFIPTRPDRKLIPPHGFGRRRLA